MRDFEASHRQGQAEKSLRMAANFMINVVAIMGKNVVSTGTLRKICGALNCEVADIAEFTAEED